MDIVKRIKLTEQSREFVEGARGLVQFAEEDLTDGDLEYARGVIDALAFVWAGCPEDAANLYRVTNSQFAKLMKRAGL